MNYNKDFSNLIPADVLDLAQRMIDENAEKADAKRKSDATCICHESYVSGEPCPLHAVKEDEESDAEHGKIASGKVPNADGITRESVEVQVQEDYDKQIDQESCEVSNRARPPKWAGLVHERGLDWQGYRLQLSFASGHSVIMPAASDAPLADTAAVFEYVNEAFKDLPDWIEAIEKCLLDC